MPAELSFPNSALSTHSGDFSNEQAVTTPPTPDANAATNGGDLMSRVVQGAHQTIDRLAESAAPHVHKLQEGMSSAGGMASARAGQVRETGEEWAESVRATVRENPLGAVVTAVAVGLLIARITR